MDNRRLLIALLLSTAVLLLWWSLFPPQPVPDASPERQAEPVAESAAPLLAPPREGPGEAGATVPAEPLPPAETIAAATLEGAVLETERFRAEFTNRGAQLMSFALRQHRRADGSSVDLVRRRQGLLPFALLDAGGTPSALNEALFVVERGGDRQGEWLEFRYSGPQGGARKRFTARADGMIGIEIDYAGATAWGVLIGPGVRNPEAEEAESRFAKRAGVYLLGDDVQRLDAARSEEATRVSAAGLGWAGLEDTYFLTAVAPTAGWSGVRFEPVTVAEAGDAPLFALLPAEGERTDEEDERPRELRLVLECGDASCRGDAFLGAKQYERLAALPHGFEQSVRLGMFSFLARPLLAGLRWIYANVVSNYGWAIILMTVLIKLILFPLTHKSTVSMQKMQEINPKVQAIRQKYRPKLKDKQGRPNVEAQQKMNQEVMALYKQEGVNPAGGCLPIVLQLPVLFAFYNLLSSAVELRNSPWMFWIQDLSARDPLYVLPIVMGASQFVQQRLTPPAGDPAQRRIFMMMPIFFTVLFLGFPSGMVLYWLTNNVLTIAQQAIYKKYRQRSQQAAEQKPDKKDQK